MTTESVGTARLDLVVDTSQFDVAIDRAESRTESFSKAGQKQYESLSAAQKKHAQSLLRQVDTIGLSKEAQTLYNAQMKLGGPLVDDLTRRLKANAAAAEAASKANSHGAVSLKQQQAAMRGLPAQITDIVTSLQGGQAPLTVLLQQGGQLKDMFGGIRPAASALTAQLAAMINPVTVSAAVAVALAAAWHSGSQEAVAFDRAIILTGNSAGVTAGELGILAERLSGLDTRGRAAAALAEITSAGKFTVAQLESVGRAALAMSELTGQSTQQTIQDFEKLRGSPSKALVELNDKYHFLTAAVYEQVAALEDQGRTQEAATLAMEVASRALAERRVEIVNNLGFIEKAWLRIKTGATAAIDAMMNIGRGGGIDDQIKASSERIAQLQDRADPVAMLLARDGTLDAAIADERAKMQGLLKKQRGDWQKAAADALPQQAAALQSALDQEARLYADNAEKRKDKIAEIEKRANEAIAVTRRVGGVDMAKNISKIEEDRRNAIAGIERKFKDPKTPKVKAPKADPVDSLLKRVNQQIALNEEQAKSEDRLSASEKLRVQVEEEIQRIGTKGTAAKVKDLQDRLKILDVTGKQLEADRRRAELETFTAAQDERSRALKEDLDAMVARVTLGEREFEIQSRISDEYQKQAESLRRLNDKLVAKQIDKSQYEEWAQVVKDTTERNVATIRDGYVRMAQAQGDWINGAKAALEDFNNRTSDVAGNAKRLFENAFDGLTDVLSDFVTGGKAGFKDFADSVARDLARMFIQQGVNNLAQKFMPGLLGGQGGGGGGGAGLLGALFGGGRDAGSGEAMGSIFDLFTKGFAKGGAFAGGVEAFAKGGVFDPSAKARAQAFATGGIVSKPSYFGMSGGRLGLMGEAGPEAIMPLRRMAGGRLGIEAQIPTTAATHGGDTNLSVVQNVVVQGVPNRQTLSQLESATGRAARRSMGRNGR